MRLEGQNAGREAQLARRGNDTVDQGTVPEMHAVEAADGQRTPAAGGLQRAVRDHHGVVKMLIIDENSDSIVRGVMRSIEEQMSTYAAYHQDPRNKATH